MATGWALLDQNLRCRKSKTQRGWRSIAVDRYCHAISRKRFFPAADVDVVLSSLPRKASGWVEVASERFGLRPYPTILCSVFGIKLGLRCCGNARRRHRVTDIPSPSSLKSFWKWLWYDGPPYNAGSSDILTKSKFRERRSLSACSCWICSLANPQLDARIVNRLLIRKRSRTLRSFACGDAHGASPTVNRTRFVQPMSLRRARRWPLEVDREYTFANGFSGENLNCRWKICPTA